MTEGLFDLQNSLEAIDLRLKNGVAALEAIAEKLTNDDTGEPEGPALYFLAEGFEVQQRKLRDCIDTLCEARKVERPAR